MRRLSPLESTYTKDRATEICLQTLEALGFDLNAQPNIKLDLDDRPQKSPRACVIASDPPKVVHLITRAQGGLHDYQAFLHEAGHALHYGGCDPNLPYIFRRIARDHALTEIYSYIVEAISREPEWHELYFGLSPEQARENAEATTFLEALLYRRYEAKLRFELDFWSRFNGDGGDADVYERLLTEATRRALSQGRTTSPTWTPGFYSADYLRAWIRSAQLRAHLIERGRRGLVAEPGRPASCCASSSVRARSRRARRSRGGSASTRSTRRRCCTKSAPRSAPRAPCDCYHARGAGQRPPRPKRRRKLVRTSVEIGAFAVLLIVVLALLGVVLHAGRTARASRRRRHRRRHADPGLHDARPGARADAGGVGARVRDLREAAQLPATRRLSRHEARPRGGRRRCRSCPLTG